MVFGGHPAGISGGRNAAPTDIGGDHVIWVPTVYTKEKMGKLHSLRRAIEREPEKYMVRYPSVLYVVKAARFHSATGQWQPYSSFWGGAAYRSFVLHVLESLGYQVRL